MCDPMYVLVTERSGCEKKAVNDVMINEIQLALDEIMLFTGIRITCDQCQDIQSKMLTEMKHSDKSFAQSLKQCFNDLKLTNLSMFIR